MNVIAIVGYVMIGVGAYNISKKLWIMYPFGEKHRKFWWSKYIPPLGFALTFFASLSIWIMFLGVVLIIGSIFFLLKSEWAW